MNWQHCNNVVNFPSHSYEQYYQLVRRCWRFGQEKPVTVTTVTTDGEERVLKNLQRKSAQCDAMFSSLVHHMVGSMKIDGALHFGMQERVPSWL